MDLVADTLAGSQLAGARLIRLLDDEDPAGTEAIRKLYSHTGKAYILGITGPPGAGKSSLVDCLIAEWRRRDLKVAVLAIDPSSPFSGGAILGDRVRMQSHAMDDGVFVRSMATRGQLGGLSRSTFEASMVLDAMGYDVIIVETVGVGQDELEVVDLAHSTVVVSIPGMGDDVQAMKAGILEIGDVFVINKADLPGVDRLEKQLFTMLHLRHYEEGDWQPPLVKTSAQDREGITALVDACLNHRQYAEKDGGLERKIQSREFHFFRQLLSESATRRLLAAVEDSDDYESLIADLKARDIDPYTAAERLTERLEYRR